MKELKTLIVIAGPTTYISHVFFSAKEAEIVHAKRYELNETPSSAELVNLINEFRKENRIYTRNVAILSPEFNIKLKPLEIKRADLDQHLSVLKAQELTSQQVTRVIRFDFAAGSKYYSGSFPMKGIKTWTQLEGAAVEEAWRVFYLSDTDSHLRNMCPAQFNGIANLGNIPKLMVYNRTGQEIYDCAELGVTDWLSIMSEQLGVSLAVTMHAFKSVGIVRAPDYCEQLEVLGINPDKYFTALDEYLPIGFGGLKNLLASIYKQKPDSRIGICGEYSMVNGILNWLLPEETPPVFAQIPSVIESSVLSSDELHTEWYDTCLAINAIDQDETNFSSIPHYSNSEEQVWEQAMKVAELEEYQLSGAVITTSADEVDVEIVDTDADSDEVSFSPVASVESIVSEGAIPRIRRSIQPEDFLGDVIVPDLGEIPENRNKIRLSESQTRRSPQGEVLAQPMVFDKTEVQQLDPTATSEEIKAILSHAIASCETKKSQLGNQLLFLGISLLSAGIIAFSAAAGRGKPVDTAAELKRLQESKSLLSEQIAAKRSYTRMSTKSLDLYLPFIEFIGSVDGSSLVISDFNLIGQDSLQLSGIAMDSVSFEQMLTSLRNISDEMDVILEQNEITSNGQSFTIAISSAGGAK